MQHLAVERLSTVSKKILVAVLELFKLKPRVSSPAYHRHQKSFFETIYGRHSKGGEAHRRCKSSALADDSSAVIIHEALALIDESIERGYRRAVELGVL